MTITPDPDTLGLESPAVGPWFDQVGVTLAVPNADLSVSVTATADLVAFPPANGLLGYHVASTPRPAGLRRLRNAAGAPAFTDGNLVALFTLLPEVEQRLFTLAQGIVPAIGGAATAGVPTRATVRHLAYEFSADSATIGLLEAIAAPQIGDTAPDATTDEDKAAHLGLAVGDGGTLVNGEHPMTEVHVAGEFSNERAPMINIGNRAFTLWAFDDNGRAIDPGAVASWWNHMATTLFTNLWAAGDIQRTVSVAARLTVHLVNPAEGVLDQNLLDRVDASALSGSGAVRSWNGTAGAAVGFTDEPRADDAPEVMAMLPNGTYAPRPQNTTTSTVLTLYPNGPVHADLTRDYIRVGVVDVERHLVGQPRTAADGADDEAVRRAADQSRATTRVAVNRVTATNLTMHTTIDTAAAAMLAGFAANPTTLVMPSLDREYASLTAPSLGTGSPPTAPPTITAEALIGGGATEGDRIDGQVVLLRLQFEGWTNAVNGAWVRVWPHGFDFDRGRHVPLDGGGGVAVANGNSASVDAVVTLPNGVVENREDLADLGCDVAVLAGSTSMEFADVRFARPTPAGGTPIDVADADQLVACEVGPVSSTTGPRPGSTLFSIQDDGTFALVDRTTVADAGFTGSIDAAITTDDTVLVTQPPWVQSVEGDVLASGDLANGTVQRAGRTGLATPTAPGLPHPTMEFYEAAATSVAGSPAVTATIAPAAGLRRHHELPPHMLGHPGAPASREAAGAGVSVSGLAALAVGEVTRDRANPSTEDLVTAATPAPPVITAVTAPSPWVAVLRTIGFGVDGDLLVSQAVRLAEFLFPGFDNVQNVVSWLEGVVNALPSTFDVTGDVPRAVSRRLLSAGWGLREVATSLDAAFGRAEDLVYVETPAIDTLPFGAEDDSINPVQTLVDRLADRPALHVVLCLPRRSPPGWPAKLGRVRDALAQQAIAALEAAGPGRVGVFHPAAGRDRALDLASTAVVVDDAYAIVGTSHLWRRGLSFDGGLAGAVFDDRLTLGRPTAVRAFRLALLAQRLGSTAANLPIDPAEIVAAVRELAEPGAGFGRATTEPITTPDPVPNAIDFDLWNRDGSATSEFDPFTWLVNAEVQSEFDNEVP
jgi:hypothetical protein